MGRRRTSETPRPEWARALIAARTAAGLKTQAAFGKAIGYAQQSVGAWESGKARIPPESVPDIARVLGISPAQLLPPGLAAAMEPQQRLSAPADIDGELADLIERVHDAMSEAGQAPRIRTAARFALSLWRMSGGTLELLPNDAMLSQHVQNLREAWRDITAQRPKPA